MTNEELFKKDRYEWEHLIDSWVFSERDREVAKKKLLDKWTHQQIADKFEISVRTSNTIVKRVLNILCSKV